MTLPGLRYFGRGISHAAKREGGEVAQLTEEGILQFTLTVEPQASETIDIKYTVAFPSREHINGLPI